MEYCRVWAGARNCHLEVFDKLQKQTCRIVGHSLAVSLKLLAHSHDRCTHYSNRLHDFSVTIWRYYKDASV